MTKQGAYVGIALAGAALGAVAGLLLAPAPGRETRRRLARRFEEEKDAAVRSGRRAVDYVQLRVSEGRERLSRFTSEEPGKGRGAA